MNRDLKGRKILILGASTWQLPYIIKAKELGLAVCASDWSPEAVGAQYADTFEPIDLKDKEATLSFARHNSVEAVFTSADIGITTAAFVAEHLGLPFHSNEVAFLATNKFAMRNRASEAGLGTPKYILVDNITDAIKRSREIGFPLIIKPVDNCSSRGVRYLNNISELEDCFYDSINSSFTKKVLLEEFMTGTEGSIEAIIDNGTPVILAVCDKTKSPLPYRYDLQLNYPGSYTEDQYKLIRHFTETLVRSFEVKDGIVHIEIMIETNSVKLIEFAVRGCGSKITTHLIPAMTGFDVMEYLFYLSFGEKKPISITKTLSGVLKFIMLKPGKISSVSGVEKARQIGGILDLNIEPKPGDIIGAIKDGRSRPGYMLAVADSKNQLDVIVKEAEDRLVVSYLQ